MNSRQRKGVRWFKTTLFIFSIGVVSNVTLAILGDQAKHLIQASFLLGLGLVIGAAGFGLGWLTGSTDPKGDAPKKGPLIPWWGALILLVLLIIAGHQGSKEQPLPHPASDLGVMSDYAPRQ